MNTSIPLLVGVGALVCSCSKPQLDLQELKGIWRASPAASTVPNRDIQMPPIEIIFSKDGFDCPGLETNGKWTIADGRVTLHPAVKSPTLEVVDIGKVAPGNRAQPIAFAIEGSPPTLVWRPQGGNSSKKPVYVFEKEP